MLTRLTDPEHQLMMRRAKESATQSLHQLGIYPQDAERIWSLAGTLSLQAYGWTERTVTHMDRVLTGSHLCASTRDVHAITLVRQAWSEMVRHTGSTKLLLADSKHREWWIEYATFHLGMYRLKLPHADPVISLRIMRAGLVILPYMY